tara:strand:+ start:1877 stop:2425 length:549 start_codon:yes stop_codon:yes gene_type:complete
MDVNMLDNMPTNMTSATEIPFERPWGNYLLEKIVETQTPSPIDWLPQTLAWQVLFILLIIVVISKSYRAYKNYQADSYRREALKWLVQYQQEDEFSFYQQLPQLLRKTALAAFKRSVVIPLSSSAWEQWLDDQCEQSDFVNACPNLLHQLAFAPNIKLTDKQKSSLFIQVECWIKHHRRHDD